MLQVQGFEISGFPLEELKLINELQSFEGSPLLLHYKDKRDADVFAYWVDFSEDINRWLYAVVTKKELFDYLIGKKSLKEIFTSLDSDYVFLIDHDVDDNVISSVLVPSKSFPLKYLPHQKSFYLNGLSPFYENYLLEFSYINKLREKAYIFKAEPVNDSHQHTVGAKEAAFLLANITNSIEGYIKVKSYNIYKEIYGDLTRLKRKVNRLKAMLSPRIADASFNSFEVWVAMDVVTYHGEDKYDFELRNGLVQGYKDDVLSIDFTNKEDAERIAKKFTPDERKMIYEPFLKVLDHDDFVLSVSDYYGDKRIVKSNAKLSASFKDTLFPPPTIEEIQEEMDRKNNIVMVFLNLKEGEDITKVGKRRLVDNLIFKENVAEAPHEFNSPIVIENRKVDIKKPLRCILAVDGNGNLELYNSLLGLYAKGTELPEVSLVIKRQFISLVAYYEANRDLVDDRFIELKQYL